MEGQFKKYISFHFFFFFFVYTFILIPQQLLAQPTNGTVCDSVNCGQGKCVVSDVGIFKLPFDCVCNHGWKKMQIGPVTFPACTVPNCTVNIGCGNDVPPLPLPPPPPPAINNSPFNISPCIIAWCGDGSCVADGIGYTCKCNEGSENLFNLTGAACFKPCSLGGDCNGVAIGGPYTPALITPSGNYYPPPPGSNQVPNCSPKFGKFALLSVCLIFMLGSKLMWEI